MNKEEYLDRIGHPRTVEPTLKQLQQLQKAHLFSVPFENLDIHYGHVIKIDQDKIFEKIVIRRRGGFCYELNFLFSELLRVLGFDTKIISARVYDEAEGYGAEFDHLAIVVKLNDHEYLTDVGFGAFTVAPLKLELETLQKDENGDFVLDRYDETYLRVNKIIHGKKIPQYIFSTTNRSPSEFGDQCHYHQTSPDSHFTKKRLITLPTQNGRVTITGNTLKILENHTTTEIAIVDEEMFEHQLWEYFKVKM